MTDNLAKSLTKWQSLDSLLSYFRDESRCRKFLLSSLYPEGLRCPYCGGVVIYECGAIYHCDECNRNFTVKVNTIFHSTKLPLRKWFAALWLTLNNKKGISAAMLSREIGVTYTTAWHMLHKIRRTLSQSTTPMSGQVQVDAAYVGGQLRWIAHKPEGYNRGDYLRNKISVLGLSGDRLVMKAIPEGNWRSIRPILKDYLSDDAVIFSDQGQEFMRIGKELHLIHAVVNHDIRQFTSPDGATTNRIEGAWSHLKRHQRGIYHKLTRAYAQVYIDEFVYRWNARNLSVSDRMRAYMPNVRVKVTWKELKVT